CCCTCICSTVYTCSTEATEIQQSFWCPIKHNTNTIHQIDNQWGCITHCFYWWLVCYEVTTINCVIKLFPRRVTFPFSIDSTIDTDLSTNGVRAFNRYNGKQIYGNACLSSFNGRH